MIDFRKEKYDLSDIICLYQEISVCDNHLFINYKTGEVKRVPHEIVSDNFDYIEKNCKLLVEPFPDEFKKTTEKFCELMSPLVRDKNSKFRPLLIYDFDKDEDDEDFFVWLVLGYEFDNENIIKYTDIGDGAMESKFAFELYEKYFK